MDCFQILYRETHDGSDGYVQKSATYGTAYICNWGKLVCLYENSQHVTRQTCHLISKVKTAVTVKRHSVCGHYEPQVWALLGMRSPHRSSGPGHLLKSISSGASRREVGGQSEVNSGVQSLQKCTLIVANTDHSLRLDTVRHAVWEHYTWWAVTLYACYVIGQGFEFKCLNEPNAAFFSYNKSL